MQYLRGNKLFELSNHLGNVLVTINDRKTPVDAGTYTYSSSTQTYTYVNATPDGNIDYFSAVVVTANDYYPFGMNMPGRKFVSGNSGYRYGFNGKEDDKDAGEGVQDYGFRIYSERLGKFLSVDPLTQKYPFYTPYQFAANSPIMSVDIDGLEASNNPNQNESPKNTSTVAAVQAANNKLKILDPVTTTVLNLLPKNKTGDKILGAATGFSEAVGAFVSAPIEALKHPVNTLLGIGQIASGTPNVAGTLAATQNYVQSFQTNGESYTNANYLSYGITTVALAIATGPKRLGGVTTAESVAGVTTNAKPNSVFLGGAKGALFSKQNVIEGNHLPTMNSIKNAGLVVEYKQAAAIQMLYAEHRSFLSTGNSGASVAFRAQETALLKSGDYMGAFELNAKRIQMDYGSKYDNAINQAREHYKTHVITLWNPQ